MAERKNISVERAQELTESMLSASKDFDWDLLSDIMPQRDVILHHFFSTVCFSAENSVKIKQAIDTILRIDQEISVFCATAADECQRQLVEIRQNNRAIEAYSAKM